MITEFKKYNASGGRTSWAKKINSIDLSKDNGYSLIGDFLKHGENDLSIGDIIVEKYPVGSAKNGYNLVIVYKISENTDDKIFEDTSDYWEVTSRENMQILKTFAWETEFLSAREYISSLMEEENSNPLANYSTEELLAEIKRRK